MNSTALLSFAHQVKLETCGVDIRRLLPDAREVLVGWLNGEVPTSLMLHGWPTIPTQGGINSTAECVVNALAPIL